MSVKIPPLFKCKERTDVNRTQYVFMLLLKKIPVKVNKHLIVAVLMMAPNMYSPVLCSSQRGGRATERKPIQTRVDTLSLILHYHFLRNSLSCLTLINNTAAPSKERFFKDCPINFPLLREGVWFSFVVLCLSSLYLSNIKWWTILELFKIVQHFTLFI